MNRSERVERAGLAGQRAVARPLQRLLVVEAVVAGDLEEQDLAGDAGLGVGLAEQAVVERDAAGVVRELVVDLVEPRGGRDVLVVDLPLVRVGEARLDDVLELAEVAQLAVEDLGDRGADDLRRWRTGRRGSGRCR